MSDELKWLLVQNNQIVWDHYPPSNGNIALSPGESSTIARVTEEPTNAPVIVEVAALEYATFCLRVFDGGPPQHHRRYPKGITSKTVGRKYCLYANITLNRSTVICGFVSQLSVPLDSGLPIVRH